MPFEGDPLHPAPIPLVEIERMRRFKSTPFRSIYEQVPRSRLRQCSHTIATGLQRCTNIAVVGVDYRPEGGTTLDLVPVCLECLPILFERVKSGAQILVVKL